MLKQLKTKDMNYDDWKLAQPTEEPENECLYCGENCKGNFCDNDCRKAYNND